MTHEQSRDERTFQVLWLAFWSFLAVVLFVSLVGCANPDAPTPSPTPAPSATPVAEDACTILKGSHAVTVLRGGKVVNVKPSDGWKFTERPTITVVPIFAGDADGRDTHNCRTFTQANSWEFRPLGECRPFADDTSGLVQELACRRPIIEGLFARTLVPDPNNPQRAITAESNWNVHE